MSGDDGFERTDPSVLRRLRSAVFLAGIVTVSGLAVAIVVTAGLLVAIDLLLRAIES